ncbi:antibiotic biosynthesis monooxygenase family protein [Actinosynnema sp. CA-299493]
MNEQPNLIHSTVGAVVLTDAVVDTGVTMINIFEVPVAESDRFKRRWQDNAEVMSRQPGFQGAQMFEALADEARFRFVNVVKWATGTDLANARKQPEWRASVQRLMDDEQLHVRANPMVYRTALEVALDEQP